MSDSDKPDSAPDSYYAHHLFFCCNQRDGDRQCCANDNAEALRNYCKHRVKQLKLAGEGKVRVNLAGCLDRCKDGPVMVVYPEGVWYHYRDERDIDEIVDSHLLRGEPVERLRI